MKKNVLMATLMAVSFAFAVPAEAQIKFGVKAASAASVASETKRLFLRNNGFHGFYGFKPY